MKNIIFPTDFSKNAEKAFEFAVQIAKKLNGNLVIVNAYDLPYSQNVMSTSLIDIMRETSATGVNAVARQATKLGVNHTSLSLMGNPIRVVKELSNKYEDSMVVLGTKGASGLEEVLIGSNAASILHSVDVPVLAIPSKAEIGDINKIVYCSDFKSKKNDRALVRLVNFASVFDASIDILHVENKNEHRKEDFERKFATILGETNYTLTIQSSNNIEQSINEFVQDQKADLVSLLVRRYGFMEGLFHSSITSKVAYHTTVPFLALHETR